MSAKSINTMVAELPAIPSQKEEVAILWAIHNLMPDGSFLAALFSPDMVRWCQDQIESDILPDLHGWYVNENTGHRTDNAHYEKRIASLDQQFDELTKARDTAQLANTNLVNTVHGLRDELAGANEAISDREAELRMAQFELEARNNKINLLKAWIFNLEHPDEA